MKNEKITVLIYIEDKNKNYLMIHKNKKKLDLNKNKYLGIGGHVEDGEEIDHALIREVFEETNLKLNNYIKRGIIEFINDDYKEIMHLYYSADYIGDIKPNDEGDLIWVNKYEICNLNIWEGDKIFLDMLINSDDFINIRLKYKNDKFIGWEKL